MSQLFLSIQTDALYIQMLIKRQPGMKITFENMFEGTTEI